jgi:hypothetical protein
MPHTGERTAEILADAMLADGAALGFGPAGPDAPAALALAARLMGCRVACPEAVAAVVALQPAAALVLRRLGRPIAVVATLLLRQDQGAAVVSGTFDGLSPRPEQICAPGATASIYYIWGVAGETRAAKWAAMELCRRFRFETLADLTALTRVATEDGRRAAIERLGFGPLRRTQDDLLISPPSLERRAA